MWTFCCAFLDRKSGFGVSLPDDPHDGLLFAVVGCAAVTQQMNCAKYDVQEYHNEATDWLGSLRRTRDHRT